ncbi:MAG: DNA gyrase inhibitor YacG [Acidobacteria bacterium]|nr:MAG: DNA gyrase inhibitor YacG [Acidobacteriota bacterium]
MRCPLCKKPAPRDGNPDWPFCSERCRLLDLDNWLTGRYRVESALDPSGSTDGSGAREIRQLADELTPPSVDGEFKGERD